MKHKRYGFTLIDDYGKEIKYSDDDLYSPNNLNYKNQKSIKDKLNTEKYKLYCSCNNKVEYKIRNNDAYSIYPAKQNTHNNHEKECIHSIPSKSSTPGLTYDAITDVYKVNISYPKLKSENKNTNKSPNYNNVSNPNEKHQSDNTPFGFVTSLNRINFKVLSENNFYKFPDINSFNNALKKDIFHKVKLDGNKSIAESYVNGYTKYNIGQFQYDIFNKNKINQIQSKICFGHSKIEYTFDKDTYDYALELFESMYNGMTVESALNKGYDLISFAFIEYKDRFLKVKHKTLGFFIVNKYGLYCESSYELEMYNYICDYINNNKLGTKLRFYKPFDNNDLNVRMFYNNNKLQADGVFIVEKTKDVFLLEVFGMDKKSYIKEKEEKEELANNKLISWDACPTYRKDKPDLNNYFKILLT